ncbi:MAG: hypothetical protein ABI862_15420, partial [Ilumatobacteraceae bacterium]
MHSLHHPRPSRRVRCFASLAALAIAAGAFSVDGPGDTSAAPTSGRLASATMSASPHASITGLRATGAPPDPGTAVLHASDGKTRTDTTPVQRAAALGALPCDDDPAALCGQFIVPLDRARRDRRTTPIDFRLIPHTGPGAAVSTVWWNGGGPGPSTT